MGSWRRGIASPAQTTAGNAHWSGLAAEIISLLAFQAALLWGFWNHLDLHIWDEAWYLHRGWQLTQGQIELTLAWGPLYDLAYAALLAVLPLAPSGGIAVTDVMFVLCAAGSMLAVWWAARAILPGPLATLLAAWWGASDLVVRYDARRLETAVSLFGMMFVALAIGSALRGRHDRSLGFQLAGFFVRPEFAVWIAAQGGGLWLLGRQHGDTRLRRIGFATLGCGLIALTALSVTPDAEFRRGMAFRQHYTQGAIERGAATEAGEGFKHPDRIFERDFGGTKSVRRALLTNPAAVGRHLVHNLALLPGSIAALCADSLRLLPRMRIGLVAGFLVLALIGAQRGLRRGRWAAALASVQLWSLMSPLAILAPVLLIRPSTRSLAPLALSILLSLGLAAHQGSTSLGRLPRPIKRFGVPLLLLAVSLLAPAPFRGPAVAMDYRQAIEVLRSHHFKGRPVLLGTNAFAFAALAGPIPMETIDLYNLYGPRSSLPPFAEVLEKHRPDYVLRTPDLIKSASQRGEVEAALAPSAWEELVTKGETTLFRRRSMGRDLSGSNPVSRQ